MISKANRKLKNMNKRSILNSQSTDCMNDCMITPALKRRNDDCLILANTVEILSRKSGEETFLLNCYLTAKMELIPIIITNESLLLELHSELGKKLIMILMIAIAVLTDIELKNSFHADWFLFVRKNRNDTAIFQFSWIYSWYEIKSIFIDGIGCQTIDRDSDELLSLPDEVIDCFQNCQVRKCSNKSSARNCSICLEDFDGSTKDFFKCGICNLHFCDSCDDRRVNWK